MELQNIMVFIKEAQNLSAHFEITLVLVTLGSHRRHCCKTTTCSVGKLKSLSFLAESCIPIYSVFFEVGSVFSSVNVGGFYFPVPVSSGFLTRCYLSVRQNDTMRNSFMVDNYRH